MHDSHGLERFVDAQRDTYDTALAEIRAGRKRTHWMWFVFPQIAGLGRSETAEFYAITDLAEARAYLAHEILGPRLIECTTALTALTGSESVAIFGPIDAQKLRSCMTLFAVADPTIGAFTHVLDRYYGGEPDPETTHRLPPEGNQG